MRRCCAPTKIASHCRLSGIPHRTRRSPIDIRTRTDPHKMRYMHRISSHGPDPRANLKNRCSAPLSDLNDHISRIEIDNPTKSQIVYLQNFIVVIWRRFWACGSALRHRPLRPWRSCPAPQLSDYVFRLRHRSNKSDEFWPCARALPETTAVVVSVSANSARPASAHPCR